MSLQTVNRPPFWCIKCGRRVRKATLDIPDGAIQAFDAHQTGSESKEDLGITITVTLVCHKEVETRQYTPTEFVKFTETALARMRAGEKKFYHRAFEPKPRTTEH